MKSSLFIVTMILVMCLTKSHPNKGQSCTTPDGETGVCYNIRYCPKLVKLSQTAKNKPQDLEFLRRSFCGFVNGDPRMCCSTINKNESLNIFQIPSPPECGQGSLTSNRIEGGVPAVLGAWPWMAALGYKNSKSVISYNCGGTLISKKHVITAAHCLSVPKYVARLGDLDLDENVKDGASPVNYVIERYLAHPRYDSHQHVNDIAILYLKNTVVFTAHIKPICLPKMEKERKNNFDGLDAFVTGFGEIKFRKESSSALLQVQIPVVSNEKCQKAFTSLKEKRLIRQNLEITPKELCAGSEQGGKDSCRGDSGGPLMLPIKKHYYLIGVVAYGYECGKPGIPGVYTRVTEYIDWINNSTK